VNVESIVYYSCTTIVSGVLLTYTYVGERVIDCNGETCSSSSQPGLQPTAVATVVADPALSRLIRLFIKPQIPQAPLLQIPNKLN